MRAVLVVTILQTGLLLAPSGAFGQTGTPAGKPAPAASVAESIAKMQQSQITDAARRPYPLAGGGQQALVVMHGWGPTYVPQRPEEIPVLAAPQVLNTGVYPWSRNVEEPRTWPLFSIQAPCWKC